MGNTKKTTKKTWKEIVTCDIKRTEEACLLKMFMTEKSGGIAADNWTTLILQSLTKKFYENKIVGNTKKKTDQKNLERDCDM